MAAITLVAFSPILCDESWLMADFPVPGFLARARPLNPSYAFIGKTLADRKCDLEYQLSIHPGPHSGPREALERVRIFTLTAIL